jgi:heme-degrading monooxygenase HmoA
MYHLFSSFVAIYTMDNVGHHGNRTPKEITEVISRNIKPSHGKDYDDWLRRYMKLESEVPGYLGTTIIAPGSSSSSVRYVINRFADKASLDAWENSEEARKLFPDNHLINNPYKIFIAEGDYTCSVADFTGTWHSDYKYHHILNTVVRSNERPRWEDDSTNFSRKGI